MDPRAFLMGSASPGFSFKVPGDNIVGQIIAQPTVQQQKVYGKEELAFWPSGDPKWQMLVQVKTGFRNYEGIGAPDRTRPDDGTRTIYIKGKHFEPAVKRAILSAGAQFLDVGGWLNITYTGEDMESKAGQKPKMFTVAYLPPPPGSQPVQQAPAAPPAAPPAPAWQQPGWSPQSAAQPVVQSVASPDPWAGQHAYPANPTYAPAQPAVPSHHGQPDQMPQWAQAVPVSVQPASPAPAPVAAPMSTLEALRAQREQSVQVYAEEPPY